MNERIKELAKQAAAVFTDVHAVSLLDDEIEKFAKLIIHECAYVAWLTSAEGDGSHIAIKKHFGVE